MARKFPIGIQTFVIKTNSSSKVRMDPITSFLDFKKAKITHRIGQGGFKQVFEIEINGTKEALKVTKLFDENEIDPDKQEELKNELLATIGPGPVLL